MGFHLNVKDFEYHSNSNSLVYQGFTGIFSMDSLKSIPFLDVRLPIHNDNLLFCHSKNMIDYFKNFIHLYSIIYKMQKKYLIPIFCIFYNDNTFCMKYCFTQSKSTYCQKINEIAK